MSQQIEQDAELLQDYLTECEEFLQQLDQDLVALESAPEDAELLNRIFRAFHTIKGTSGFLGYHHIVELTHHAEDVLNILRKGERKVTRHVMDVLLAALDQLRQMIRDLRGGATREYQTQGLVADLKALFETAPGGPSPQQIAPPAPENPAPAENISSDTGRDSAVNLSVVDHSPHAHQKELSVKAFRHRRRSHSHHPRGCHQAR